MKKIIIIFISLFLSILNALNAYEFKNGVYVEKGSDLYFPLNTYSKTCSAGDASGTLYLNSCGEQNFVPNLNPYTCSISCTCRGSSNTCSDSASGIANCGKGNNIFCSYSIFVSDGGKCSCSCVDSGCGNCSACCCGTVGSCSSCVGGSSKTCSGELGPVDTTRFEESVNYSISVNKEKQIKDYQYDQIIWYKNPIFTVTFIDSYNDLDDLQFISYSGEPQQPPFQINHLSFTVNFQNFSTEIDNEFVVRLHDDDLCQEYQDYTFDFFVDNVGPRFFKVIKSPLNITDEDYILGIENEEFYKLSNNSLFAQKLNINDGLIIPRGLSYCKFLDNCFIFRYSEYSSGLKESNLQKISGSDLSFEKNSGTETSTYQHILEEERKVIYDEYKFNYENIDYSLQKLIGKDRLDNTNEWNLLFIFKPPKTTCSVDKEVNGYTKLDFVKCSNQMLSGLLKNVGVLYNYLSPQKEDEGFEFNFVSSFIPTLDINTIQFSNQQPLNLSYLSQVYSNLLNGKSGEYYLYYFSSDFFDNIENVTEFKYIDGKPQIKVKPSYLHLKLDYHLEPVKITSNEITYNGLPLQDIPVNQINGKLNYTKIPATIRFTCEDPETNICKIKVTLPNGTSYNFENKGSISLNNQITHLTIEWEDGLDNKKTANLVFNVTDDLPIIEYSFNETPLDNYYTFNKNVLIKINSSFLDDPNKVVKIELYNNGILLAQNNSYNLIYPLTCEAGNSCEYHLTIKAYSILGTVNSTSINVRINKNPFVQSLTPVNSNSFNFYTEDNKTYFNNYNVKVSYVCFVNQNIKEGEVKKVYIFDNNNLIFSQDATSNPQIGIKDVHLNSNEGYLKLICEYYTENTLVNKTTLLHYIVDQQPPSIKIYVGNEEVNSNNFIVENSNAQISIEVNDSLSGVKYSKLDLTNFINNQQFYNEYSFILPQGINGIYTLKVGSFDNVLNYNEKVVNLIVDNTPPIIYKQEISSNNQQQTYRFFCSDLTGCNITEVKCNGNNVNFNPSNDVQITCNFNNNGLINWIVKAKDSHGLESSITFTTYSISSPFEVVFYPPLSSFYCLIGTEVPILAKIISKTNKAINIKVNYKKGIFLSSNIKEFNVKPFSYFVFPILVSCVSKENEIKFETKIGNENYNITKQIILSPLNFVNFVIK